MLDLLETTDSRKESEGGEGEGGKQIYTARRTIDSGQNWLPAAGKTQKKPLRIEIKTGRTEVLSQTRNTAN